MPDPSKVTHATITTARGRIELELYPDVAPKSVTNFATLAERKYYDGITFHRVESWVVQAGDPTGTGAGGDSIYGGTFTDTFDTNSTVAKQGYMRGVLAMAKKGTDPAFAGSSQFFIMKVDQPLPLEYTIFGRVTAGMDVVDQLQVGDKIMSVVVK